MKYFAFFRAVRAKTRKSNPIGFKFVFALSHFLDSRQATAWLEGRNFMKPTSKTYEINIAGLLRELPIVQIADNMCIASFVLLGDSQLVIKAAAELLPKLPEVDYLITAEAKGIPLVQELARLLNMDRYFVARKSIKPYMVNPFVTESLKAMEALVKKAGGIVSGKAAILAEGDAGARDDIIFLESLPIFKF